MSLSRLFAGAETARLRDVSRPQTNYLGGVFLVAVTITRLVSTSYLIFSLVTIVG
jgi:hypothetical protein